MKLITLVLAMQAMTPAFAAEPLRCPAGAVEKRDPDFKNGKRDEWCEDTTTGKPNGPARSVNPAGTVLLNGEIRQGQIVSHLFTLPGLELMLSQVNAGFAKEAKPAYFTLIDEHALRFDMVLSGKMPGGMAIEEVKKLMVTSAPICRMFAAPGTDFRTIDVHATNENKQALGTIVITRADCELTADR